MRRVPGTARSGWVSASPWPQAGPAWPPTCWRSVPPANTFIAWKPRQIPSTGRPRASAAAQAAASSASRSGSTVARAVHRLPVAGRIDVRAAAQQQPVHRRERRVAFGRWSRRVQGHRHRPVARDRVEIQRVLARRDLGLRLLGRDHQRDDDPRRLSGGRHARRGYGRGAAPDDDLRGPGCPTARASPRVPRRRASA